MDPSPYPDKERSFRLTLYVYGMILATIVAACLIILTARCRHRGSAHELRKLEKTAPNPRGCDRRSSLTTRYAALEFPFLGIQRESVIIVTSISLLKAK